MNQLSTAICHNNKYVLCYTVQLLPDRVFELLKLDHLSRDEEQELHMEMEISGIWSKWDVMSVMLKKISLTEAEVGTLMKLWDEALA
jgi:hypothetical protein